MDAFQIRKRFTAEHAKHVEKQLDIKIINSAVSANSAVKQLQEAGLKVTPQRVAAYKAMIESKEHPSADILWRRVRKTYPNISLDTVNSTLLTLAEIGAAFIVEGSGDVKRFDGCLESHQHFKCIKCKKIIDVQIGRASCVMRRAKRNTQYDIRNTQYEEKENNDND